MSITTTHETTHETKHDRSHRPRAGRGAATLGLALIVATPMVACEDDDDDTAADQFCATYETLGRPDLTFDARNLRDVVLTLENLADEAPPDIEDDLDLMTDSITAITEELGDSVAQDPGSALDAAMELAEFDQEAFAAATENVQAYADEHCDTD